MGEPVQKGSSRYDDSLGNQIASVLQPNPNNPPTRFIGNKQQLSHLGLQDPQIGFVFQPLPHTNPVLLLVALRPRRPHGRTAAGVQQAKLDAHGIGQLSHHAAQGVNLANDMPFGNTSNRRVAGHLGDQVNIHGDHRRVQPEPGTSARSLATRVSGANYHYVILLLHGVCIRRAIRYSSWSTTS